MIPPVPKAPKPFPSLPKVTTGPNSVSLPHIGKVEFKSTNRDFSLEATETEKIIHKHLKPIHATDPNILRFIDNYMYCRDAKQAARLTGLTAKDGTNLMNRKDIHGCIAAITAAGVRKYGYDAEEIVEKVKEIAFIDPALVMAEDGTFIDDLRDMLPEVRRGIKKFKAKNIWEDDPNGMKICVGKMIEIEFWDKMKAIEMLGTEKSTFKKTNIVEHTVGANMRDVLLASGRRAEQAKLGMRDVGEGNGDE